MEKNHQGRTSHPSEPYNLRKTDLIHEEELGRTLNMMYTLYYEMPDTGASPVFPSDRPEPEPTP